MNPNDKDYKLSHLFLIGQATARFGDLCLKPSLRNPVSTSTGSASKPGIDTGNVVQDEFAKLYCGIHFIDRLQSYVDFEHKLPESAAAPKEPYRARDLPNSDLRLPPTPQIVDAIGQLCQEELRLRQYDPLPLMTNDSAQDEVREQIIPLLNHAIKTYKCNTITSQHLPPPARRTDSTTRDHFEDVDASKPVEIDEARQLLFFPCWARHAISSAARDATSGKADYALFESPVKHGICAHGEARQSWIYTTEDIYRIYDGPEWAVASNAPYDFRSAPHYDYHPINSLLKMAFGQIRILGSYIGFFTNLSVVVFYFYYDGELVMKPKAVDTETVDTPSSTAEGTVRFQLPSGPTRQATRASARNKATDAENKPEKSKKQGKSEKQAQAELDSKCKRGLVLSRPIDFTAPQLLRCMQAMTFLALDAKKWEGDGKRIVDILAPGDELQQIKPADA